jgi:hypothetical protein
MGAQAAGFLSTPPGLDGDPGLGIPGFTGVARAREWDAVESANAPDLRGDEVHFVAVDDPDRTVIVDEDEPTGASRRSPMRSRSCSIRRTAPSRAVRTTTSGASAPFAPTSSSFPPTSRATRSS